MIILNFKNFVQWTIPQLKLNSSWRIYWNLLKSTISSHATSLITLNTGSHGLTKYAVRDTFDFIERIKDKNVNDKTMFSLDVSSLFTNVTLVETVNFICDYITENRFNIGLPVTTLKNGY